MNKPESPSPKDTLWKFGWNWASGSWEEVLSNFVNVFSLFCNYLPFDKGVALQLNKPESPSPKDTLWKIWLKLAQWFWLLGSLVFRRTDARRQVIRQDHLSFQLKMKIFQSQENSISCYERVRVSCGLILDINFASFPYRATMKGNTILVNSNTCTEDINSVCLTKPWTICYKRDSILCPVICIGKSSVNRRLRVLVALNRFCIL